MYKVFLILLLLLFTRVSDCEAQTCQWITKASCDDLSEMKAGKIAVDSSGNTYVSGWYWGIMSIGSYTFYATNRNYFLIKFSPTGAVVWAKDFQTLSGSVDDMLGVFIDRNNDLFLAGKFDGTIMMDTITGITTSLSPFLAKLDSAGNCYWLNTNWPGRSIRNINFDRSNNLIVLCEFSGGIAFNNGTTMTSYGGINTYLAKFDSSLNCKWVSQIGSSVNNSHLKGIDSDFYDNVYITGDFNDTVKVGSIIVHGSTGTFEYCLLYAKYDSSGNPIWAKGICSEEYVMSQDLSCDGVGKVYVGGMILDTLMFDSIQVNGYTFLATMDSSGKFIRVKSYHDSRIHILQCQSLSGGGLLGYYWIDPIGQGAVYMDSIMVAPPNRDRNAIAEYDSVSQINWIDTIGSPNLGCCINPSMDVDGSENIYVSAGFMFTINVQQCQINSTLIDDYNIFLAKVSDITTNQYFIKKNVSVTAWPVPFTDHLNIHFSNYSKSYSELGLINSLGQKIYHKHSPLQDEVMDVSFLPQGIYFLVVKTDEGNITKMLVK